MKKIAIFLLAVMITFSGFGSYQGPEKEHKATHNKVTQNKVTKKTAKGVKHGAYGATHNKVTKKTDINKGNEKYKNQNDLK